MIIKQTIDSYSKVASTISSGGVVAFRTDTFYGLGADPFNSAAVQRIKELKGRDDQKPILIVFSDESLITRFISEPSRTFRLLAKTFWPGPVTLIGRAVPDLAEEITAGSKTIGVRLPADDEVRALVRACGGALTATSANPANQNPARTAAEVSGYFGEGLDLIVDGGAATSDQPSTVVDVSGNEARLIREGAVSWHTIQAAM